jgi:hypothetical protein
MLDIGELDIHQGIDLYGSNAYSDESFFYRAVVRSINDVNSNNYPFSFFDLELSEYDKFTLSLLEINDGLDLFLSYSGKESWTEEVLDFLYSITKKGHEKVAHISSIVINRVEQIILASSYYNAEIKIIAHNRQEQNYFPSWHIDKTFAEESIIEAEQEQLQNVFIFTLKGPSTLFQAASLQIREEFNSFASETSHTYGYDNYNNIYQEHSLNQLFDINKSKSAEFGQGSVHLAGYINGTIHASPTATERLVIIVTPGDIDLLKKT